MTLAAGFMSLLDVSIVTVALPSMEASLGTTPSGVQWVVSGYALAFGLALVPAGRLGDAWGRRRMFFVSLTGFVVTSALCGAAPTLELLVLARLVQGFTAGMIGPQNSGLIQDLFRGAERGRAFGMFGATVGLSTAVGPVLGGVILALAGGPDGWRWVFYVNVPVGLVTLALAYRLLPRRRTDAAHAPKFARRLDLVGTALLGAGVLAVLLPMLEYDRFGRLWWLLLVAAALLAGFALWEVRVARRGVRPPLLDPRLLTSTPGYATGTALSLTYFIGFSGLWIVLAMFFQGGLGYTPLQSGLAVTSFAVGSAFSAGASGRLLARFGRRLTVYGLVAVVVGLAGTAAAVGIHTGPAAGWLAAGPLLLAGIGGGVVISPNITLTLSEVPVRMAGAAGGALQTGGRIGAAIGTALLAGVYYGTLEATGRDQGVAVVAAMLVAILFVLVALVIAIVETRQADARARLTT
ncbi:MFS transporter [Pseudonocardia acaciae]|uniref:MFS transporter n=1 Tax=Pseudonocardia acaciae TaxID=551276 RepID=UPI000A9E5356|nr:MFS transporter [Pseudonocardia acaciae]